MIRLHLCCAAALLASASFALRQDEDPLPSNPTKEITAAELHHHVAYLASDELMGRRAGSLEANRAAEYLAKALKAAGVKPGAADGSYLQVVPMINVNHSGPPKLEITFRDGSSDTAVNGVDFNVGTRGEISPTEVLRVRTIESAEDMPAEPNPEEALFLAASSRERKQWLSGKPGYEAGWGLILTEGSSSLGRAESTPRGGRPRARGDEATDPCDTAKLRGDFAAALAEGEIASVRLVYEAEVEVIEDFNVLGRIDGVGTQDHPEMAKETIVFSAHYDHIGTAGDPMSAGEKDVVFNGADDDASGVSAVLEFAHALAEDEPPARTLLFLLAGGEEMGLIGTNYYIEHPVIPLENTVCNLNFEMIGRPDDLAGGHGKLWLSGFERSTLGARFQEAGLAVIQDPRPEQNFFQRSDNYAFAVKGIVAQTLSSYNMHSDYHQVSDEADTLDYEHMEAALRDAYAASRFLVDGSLSPEWLPGGKPEPRR